MREYDHQIANVGGEEGREEIKTYLEISQAKIALWLKATYYNLMKKQFSFMMLPKTQIEQRFQAIQDNIDLLKSFSPKYTLNGNFVLISIMQLVITLLVLVLQNERNPVEKLQYDVCMKTFKNS